LVSQNPRVREREFVTAIGYLPLATTFLRFQFMRVWVDYISCQILDFDTTASKLSYQQ
jgi:hypothetical protein